MADERGDDTVTLWRPTGAAELRLVEAAGFMAWPSRLPGQPIFYPVTNEQYAREIARDWHTRFDERVGHVTRFKVRKAHLDRYGRRIVDARRHEEYWIPAEKPDHLNENIVGLIEVTATYTEQDRLDHEAKAK